MTLRQQLFLAISAIVLAIFVALTWADVRSTRAYLEEQLASHAQDAASALVHPLSQSLGKADTQLAATQVATLFDRGYFQRIAVLGLKGDVLVNRELPAKIDEVPVWFSELFPLQAAPGEAFISAGWRQLGKVVVISQPTHAYQHLWRSLIETAIWMAVAYAAALVLTQLLLHMILKPLSLIEASAREIQKKRFERIAFMPRAPELRRVVGAMNDMSRRIKEMLDTESAKAEKFRREAYVDELTGFDNRRSFDLRFKQFLDGSVAFSEGALIGLEVNRLKEFNTEVSYREGDAYLKALADVARTVLGESARVLCRTGGGSFGFVVLDHPVIIELARTLQGRLAEIPLPAGGRGDLSFSMGVVNFRIGDARSEVMSRLDLAIESARQASRNAMQYVAETAGNAGALGSQGWRELIRNALSENRWTLVGQPVVSLSSGELIHQEIMTRLIGTDGNLVPASTFMPMALRHHLMAEVDRALLSLVFAMLNARVAVGEMGRLAVNMSSQSLDDTGFMQWLDEALGRLDRSDLNLSFELAEYGCASQPALARKFAELVRKHRARFGIDHFGLAPDSLQLLRDLPPDYIKLDAGLVAEAPRSESARAVLRAIVTLAASLEVDVIAQGVETAEQVKLLLEDHVAGGQGYHFGRPSSEQL